MCNPLINERKAMTEEPTTKTKKTPDFTAWFIHEREGCPWVAIGAAWEHADGNGFNIKLDLIPNAAGRIVLRRIKTAAADQSQTAAGE